MTRCSWGGVDGLFNQDERDIVEACDATLTLEERLIAHRDSSRAGARITLLVWFAD